MPRSNQRKDIPSLEELVLKDRRTSVLLHADKEKPINAHTTVERLKLLKAYAEIASSTGAKLVEAEFDKAHDWYKRFGYPGFVGKDWRNGDRTRGIEVNLPIVRSANSVKSLLRLYEAWHNQQTTVLLNLIVEIPQQRESVDSAIREAQDVDVKRSRAEDKRLIDDARQRKGTDEISIGADSGVQQFRQCRFKDTDVAWFAESHKTSLVHADYGYFTVEEIEPFQITNIELDDAGVLAMAEDQLIKAANIMLRGIKPAVILNGEKLQFEYECTCDWHLIATAFAELLTKKKLKLRKCAACGIDINGMKVGADKCKKCADKKRKAMD